MTIAELERAVQSKKRIQQAQAQERASFDYILADLVGRSVGRIYSSSTKLPEISEVYPNLFDSREIQQRKAESKAALSTLRFRHFAEAHNKKFKGAEKVNE